MGFDHRKLLQTQINSSAKTFFSCVKPCVLKDRSTMGIPCSQSCSAFRNPFDTPPTLPPPRPPPPLVPRTPDGDKTYQKQLMTTSMTIMGFMIGGALIFGLLMAIIRVYFFKKNNSRRRSPPILFVTQEDFVDEEHGPEIDHPIWYIHTIGLQQSIIDSITIFKYKKDEALIEGTECSVCLSEFEEDESLRLLPKCSHAFHISCIDTWLRSHKNCPLCRAPIVNDAIVAQAVVSEANSNDSGSREETRVENSENAGELSSNNAEEGGTSEVRIGDDNFGAENSADNSKSVIHSKVRNSDSDSRVLSDLADNLRVVDEDVQPMRRSVSFDSCSASMIYKAVANVNLDKSKGSSHTELVQLKNSRSKNVAKRGSGNLSISKLMKCSSIGCSLQKGPISMKRSFSSSGKFLSSRNCKSQDSFLPL